MPYLFDSGRVRNVPDHLYLGRRTDMLLDLHANPLQIEPHFLQHIDCYALSKFDQSEQQVFSSHVIVVEPLGLLARKRQDLLGAWSKIIHYCVSEAGRRLSLLKVDTGTGTLTFTIKGKTNRILR